MSIIAIIGGSGFIGTRLCKRLIDANQKIIILDKVLSATYPELCRLVDVRDVESLISASVGVDTIINLAAEHKDNLIDKKLYFSVNVGGAENIVKAAEANNIKNIIFTSSVAVYGFCAPGTDEKSELNPFHEYGQSKLQAERIFIKWFNAKPGRKLTIIRPTVVFGERNRGNVYNLLKQMTSRLFLMIGDGKNTKSMAYVENVAAFLQYQISNQTGFEIYNYIDKPDLTTEELVSLVLVKMGKKREIKFRLPYLLGMFIGKIFDFTSWLIRKQLPISSLRVKKFCSTTSFSAEKVLNSGFKAPVSLTQALGITIEYEFIEKSEKENEVLFFSE